MKFFLMSLLLLSSLLQAQPYRFELKQEQSHTHFNYRFSALDKPYQLAFSLETETLNNHFRHFFRLSPNVLHQKIWRDLQLHMATYPQATLRSLPSFNNLRYELKIKDSALEQKLKEELAYIKKNRFEHYTHEAYYILMKQASGEEGLMPDHKRIMEESLKEITPIAQALKNTIGSTSDRETVAIITSWLQQIPYHDLSSKQNAAAGFSPPLKLLHENRGDCDSKAVLLAAIFKSLYPHLKSAIVYLPNHAMLALELPATANDEKVYLESVTFLLVDPTGPALLQLGEINEKHKMFTRSQHFSYRLL